MDLRYSSQASHQHIISSRLKCQLISASGTNSVSVWMRAMHRAATVGRCFTAGSLVDLSNTLQLGFLKPNFNILVILSFFPSCRSSYTCRYFVLPCCFYDFYGKYQRRQCKKSQYREYIDFIAEVGHISGFQTHEDCLRIPSTKRVSWTLSELVLCLNGLLLRVHLIQSEKKRNSCKCHLL